MERSFLVQMQRYDGNWFTIDRGSCSTKSKAVAKAKRRKQKNLETLALRSLGVRVVERVDTVLEVIE